MRCALFGPTPGSRPSSSMRSWTTPSYTAVLHAPAGRGRRHAAEALGERAHRLLLQLGRGPVGVPDRGEHQVGEALGVVGVDGARVDLRPTTSPAPVTVAVTRPPPADARRPGPGRSSSWASTSCCCICWAWAISDDRSAPPPNSPGRTGRHSGHDRARSRGRRRAPPDVDAASLRGRPPGGRSEPQLASYSPMTLAPSSRASRSWWVRPLSSASSSSAEGGDLGLGRAGLGGGLGSRRRLGRRPAGRRASAAAGGRGRPPGWGRVDGSTIASTFQSTPSTRDQRLADDLVAAAAQEAVPRRRR